MRLEQQTFKLDTSKPLEELVINTTHMAFQGQLRFFDEDLLEDALDAVAFRLFNDGTVLRPDDLQDVPFEDLFR